MDHVIKLNSSVIAPSLFQADELAPFDYEEHCLRKDRLSPEERLLLAILADAVACYQGYFLSQKAHEQALFTEAEEWIFDGSTEFTSFHNICEILKIDPAYVRRGLRAWKESQLERVRVTQAKRRWRSVAHGQRSLRIAALRK
jgi:hypothetical protein